MLRKIKNLIKLFTPEVIIFLYEFLFRNNNLNGIYHNWNAAQLKSTGYDSDIILERVEKSLQQVKDNHAVYERDGVLFFKKDFNLHLFSALGIAQFFCQNISVLDFGGSLGSTYYQYINIFKRTNWCIVEQNNFVQKGKEKFETENLKFFNSIKECMEFKKCNFLLLSSVLQYIENPIELIDNIMQFNFEWILIDRTPFFKNRKYQGAISIQQVHKSIYNASFPIHIFNLVALQKCFQNKYEVEFIDDCREEWLLGCKRVTFKCLLLKKRSF